MCGRLYTRVYFHILPARCIVSSATNEDILALAVPATVVSGLVTGMKECTSSTALQSGTPMYARECRLEAPVCTDVDLHQCGYEVVRQTKDCKVE